MYQRLLSQKSSKHFGAKTAVLKGDRDYLIIVSDRDEISYFFADMSLEKLYPVNSYMKSISFAFDFENAPDQLDCDFDIDLDKYGFSQNTEWVKNLILSDVRQSAKM